MQGVMRMKGIIYLIMSLLVALGIYGLMEMNKNEFPDFKIKEGLVVAVYPGATPQEVEDRVTDPLEDVLFSLSEVDREETYSYSKDGMCYIYVSLTVPSAKKEEAWSTIKHKLEAAKSSLPTGVLAVVVMDDFSSISSVMIALESTDKSYSEMKDYADDLKTRLSRIPEMSGVSIIGDLEEEIAVTLDMERMSAYGISSSTLMANYMTAGIQAPSGEFESDYAKAPIHIESSVSSEQEVGERIVFSDPLGNVVRLRDIATIERRYKDADNYVDYNGHTAIVMSLEMRPDNNIVAFGTQVNKVLEEFSQELPESVSVSKITDQPEVVRTSVTSFLRDLVISMLVVIFVLLMLFPVRSALIAASGVPITTAITIGMMYMAGIELNTVTLAALIVVLGMIVDNAIINMDGYIAYLQKGMDPMEAASRASQELFMPTFVATFAISVMFFPVLFTISGYLGEFVKLFPWVVAISLFVSFFFAFFVVPTMEVAIIKDDGSSSKGAFARVQDKFFAFIQGGYDRLEEFCFRFSKGTILVGIAAVVLGMLMFTQLNIQMMPKASRDFFAVEMYLEAGSGLDQTKAIADSLQRIMLADPRVKSVTAFEGTGAPRFNSTYAPVTPSSNFAQMIVNTVSTKATEELIVEYDEKYEHWFPECKIRFKQMDYQQVTAPVEVRLIGGTTGEMKPFADSLMNFMYAQGDLIKWVHSDCESAVAGIDIRLDEDEASRLGVNKTMLSLSLYGAFEGMALTSVWEGDREIGVNLYSGAVCDDMDYSVVGDQMIATGFPGVSVPLRQVASIEPDFHLGSITRTAGEESVMVSADMKYGRSQPEAMRRITAYVDEVMKPQLPESVRVEYVGLTDTNATVAPEIGLTFVLAVLILFFFMVFHFKKISLAVITILLSSLCLFGAAFGLWVLGIDFGITSVLGLISLVGIIVRNGIVMFEYAEELRFQQGMSVHDAAFEAGKRRMRPIFLTSCTTALGVLPMIISGDALWFPMGLVICFGTLLSLILIVLIMPISYWQIFKRADR